MRPLRLLLPRCRCLVYILASVWATCARKIAAVAGGHASPVIWPFSSTSIRSAAGRSGKPGMRTMSPVSFRSVRPELIDRDDRRLAEMGRAVEMGGQVLEALFDGARVRGLQGIELDATVHLEYVRTVTKIMRHSVGRSPHSTGSRFLVDPGSSDGRLAA